MQQGDVKLFQTPDDGNITVENGVVEMSGGLKTAAYVSLYGGNQADDGRTDNAFTWWGNRDEIDPVKQYRSETQNVLESLPATTNNLRKVEDAANRDLAWFVEKKVASSVSVVASIPALNRIKLTITIEANGIESSFEFVENWKVAT